MVRLSVASLSVLFVFSSFAAVPVEAATTCLQRDARGVASEYIQSGQAYKDFANKAISCDKCSDERMDIKTNTALGITVGVTVTSTLTRRCTAAELKAFDCKTTKRPGRIFYQDIASKTSYSISKCNPKLLSAISRSVDESDTSGAYLKQLAAEEAAHAAAPEPPKPVNLSTPDGRAQIVQELAAGAGISEEKAKEIVEKDPQAAIKAINAISIAKDDEEVRAAVKAIGLNPNLADRSTQAAMQALALEHSGLPAEDRQDEFETIETFGREAAAVRQEVLEALSPMCAQLGGCSDSGCLSNPNSLTCRTNNPGALTWSSWQAKYGGAPCGERNNTTCFPSVEHGLAAKIGLLTGPRYFGGDNNTILTMLCNGYAPNSDGNNCSSYATFVQNQTGISMNQTIDPQNPAQIGKIAMAISRMENGRSVPFTPTQLQAAMGLVYGGSLPEGTPGYVPTTRYGTNGGTEFGSPFNVNPYSGAAPATVGYGSPFAQTIPPPAPQPTYSPAPVSPVSQRVASTPAPQTRQTQSQVSGESNVAQQLLDALDIPLSSTSSPAIIITDPKDVKRGDPIVVSWATFGMSTQKPCIVRTGETVIAEGNKGSKVLPTSASTKIGSLVFTLSCTSLFGGPVQRTAATFVR